MISLSKDRITNEYKLLHGNCLDRLKELPDNSVDSIVTDPPYGLSFMGKNWDKSVPGVAFWKEALRVLKPGGHLLAFAGTRTQHRMACAIEDAGFEIRDMMAWIYGSGFPKSLDISKAIDKAAGAEREVVGVNQYSSRRPNKENNSQQDWGKSLGGSDTCNITTPSTHEAKQWSGWGTALKPALEPITFARKPLSEKTVAENVIKWGTAGLNIDGCRVGDEVISGQKNGVNSLYRGLKNETTKKESYTEDKNGRFPANLMHDGSQEVVELFPEGNDRFFYCPKASKKDRNDGLEEFSVKGKVFNGQNSSSTVDGFKEGSVEDKFTTKPQANHHPTVKPTDLMAYLVRLVTPPNGIVLDLFNGSGSTGKAAIREGFKYIGCELDFKYIKISEARINAELQKKLAV